MFLFRCKTELASTESNLISFIFQHQQTTNFCNKKNIRKRFKTTFTKPHPQHPVHPLNQDPIKVYREFTIKVCPPWSSKLAKVRLNRLLHNRKYSVTKTPRLKSPWTVDIRYVYYLPPKCWWYPLSWPTKGNEFVILFSGLKIKNVKQ